MRTHSINTLCAFSLLLMTACQAAPVAGPATTPTPVPTTTPSPSVSPSPSAPPQLPGPSPTPNIQIMTEANVLSKEESLRLDQAWSSPDGQQIVYVLERARKVRLKEGISARQDSSEAWLLNVAIGQKTRLELGDPSRYYNLRIDWIDNQNFLFIESQAGSNLQRLTKLNTASNARTTLAESTDTFDGDLGEGWYYFYRSPGKIEAVNISSGELKQWPLSGELANKHINVRAIPGGKVLLVDNRTSSTTPACPAGQPCPVATPATAFHAHLLDTASGAIQVIPALQGGEYYASNLLPSPDGSFLGWAHVQNLIVVDTTQGSEQLRLTGAELLGWLSNQQILIRRSDRLEVYDLSNKTAVAQSPLGAQDQVFGFDTSTRQVLLSHSPVKGPNLLQTISFAAPNQPGARLNLPDQLSLLEVLLGSRYERQLLTQNFQNIKGALSLLRLKPAGAGLERLLELPYNSAPDFTFAPAGASGQMRWFPL